MITLVKTTFDKTLDYYIEYTKHIRLTDTYWEQEIAKSAIFEIHKGNTFIGITSINEQNKNLTSFRVEPQYICYTAEVLCAVISLLAPKSAFVVSNDEPTLTAFTDYICQNRSAHLTTEAFFFDDVCDCEVTQKFAHLSLKQATVDDVPTLKAFDFFSDLSTNNPADVKYLLIDEGGEVLGAGHIQSMQFCEKWRAVGMVTNERYRKMGVGKAIIAMEKEICKQAGFTAIAGCSYENHASRRTLEACGFATKTRMYRIIL